MATLKTRAAYKCSLCQSENHTARNHDKATGMVQAAPSKPQGTRRCSYCYCPGHYAATCSAKAADAADKAMRRAQLARQIVGFDTFHPAHKFVSVHVMP